MALQLVEFDPDKLGEVLATQDGEVLYSSEKISAVLSLFFQWPENSSAFAYFDLPGRPSFRVKIEFDKEERQLSQLMIELPEGISLSDVSKVFLRLEIFNGCYEFESKVLDNFMETNQWLIIDAPDKLKSIKVRRSSRIEVSKSIEAKLTINNKLHIVNITSVTLNGLVINEQFPQLTTGKLQIGELVLEVYHARDIGAKSAFSIIFETDQQASMYFDFYRQTAYPGLTPRKEVDFDNLYELFVEAGFFGHFSGKFDEAARPEKAKACWKDLVGAQHSSTADYVAKEDNAILGSSSCAIAFKTCSTEYWVFHQLCAKKEIDTLDLTGDLYAWRAEYLWNRKSDITSVFWFRSESRWLERIYVKYAMQSPDRGNVKPAQLYAYIHNSENLKVPISSVEKYGSENRAYYSHGDVLGGLGPDYVHINRNMNLIQANGNWDDVYKAADSMTKALNRATSYFRVVMPHGCPPPNLQSDRWDYQNSVDRHAEIKKDGMLDFIACLRHSIAVTKRKHNKIG